MSYSLPRLFMQKFREMAKNNDEGEVAEESLICALVRTGQMDFAIAKNLLSKVSAEGLVYQRKAGVWREC